MILTIDESFGSGSNFPPRSWKKPTLEKGGMDRTDPLRQGISHHHPQNTQISTVQDSYVLDFLGLTTTVQKWWNSRCGF